MLASCIVSWICLFITPLVVAGQQCTYKCDTCEQNSHYHVNASGVCERNSNAIDFLLLGHALCWMSGDDILDEASCIERAEERFGASAGDPLRLLPEIAIIHPVWSASRGCKVEALPAPWLDKIGNPVKANMCIERRNAWANSISVCGGLLLGLIFTCLSRIGNKNMCNMTKEAKDEKHQRKALQPGAKLLAVDFLVKGGGARRCALIYRCVQLTANACLPAVLLIFINPAIVLPLYFLLYVIPAFCDSGVAIFRKPLFLVSPPDISLFGIDQVQRDFRASYLYHACRPYIMVSLSIGISYTASQFPDVGGESWAFNPSGFFRAALLLDWGPVVLDSTLLGVAFGTLIYTFATFALVFSSVRRGEREGDSLVGERVGCISLMKDVERSEEVVELAEKIVTQALEIDKLRDDPSEETKKQIWDEFFQEQRLSDLDDSASLLDVKPFSKRDLYFQSCMGLVTLAGYAWKLFVFLRAGRLFLAAALSMILGQAISLVVLNGTLYRALESVPRSAKVGVQTLEFFALAHWNESGAGVLYLMITIYGLPLANTHHWYSVLLSMAFNTKAVFSLAQVMVSVIDMDTFDVYKTPDSIRDVKDEDEAYDELGEASDEEEASEDGL